MIFEWDERKRRGNLRKHGIDFRDGATVFVGPVVTVPDDRADDGESRFVTFGLLGSRVIAIAHTETTENIRIISMRKATRYEQEQYFESIENGFEET